MNVGTIPGMAPGQTDLPPTDMLAPPDPYSNDVALLDLFDRLKREAMEYRWVWEREWLRDLYYVANRQWITFNPAKREWVDKKLQKWVPRPVTNKMAETVQAIRTNLGAINLSVLARPVGHDTESIAAAEVADQMAPLIHEEHDMNQVMREADFWLIATGNACLQLSWDKDSRFNKVFIQHEQCATCGAVLPPQAIVDKGNHCPTCNSVNFTPAQDLSGQKIGEYISFGKGKTTALSPFEYAFSPNIIRFDELPFIIRMRWRDKHYYEANLPEYVSQIMWEKSPQDRSLQIFKSLAMTNDVGTGSQMSYFGTAGNNAGEGVTEYELWMRPTPDYPQGLLLRVAGDKQPIVIRYPEEALPGPIPYTDIEGTPLFPFVHAQYEHMGGRLYGRSAISPLIQKQDQLNQLDSLVQLIIQRTANPVWIIPENAGVENITGEPGLVIKWNVLAAQGHGKPERAAGIPIDSSLFAFREQIIKDIEDLCLTGDTQVPCLDGQVRTMQELAAQFPEGGMWVYGFDLEQSRIVPSYVQRAWSTGIKPVYRVSFEEGTHVDCTANHPFLTYDRGYVRCDELKVGESLIPFLRASASSKTNDYEAILQPCDVNMKHPHLQVMEATHRMVAFSEHGLKRGESHLVVHHKDGNGLNNLPSNLEVMTREEHGYRHYLQHDIPPFPILSHEEYARFSQEYWDRASDEEKKSMIAPIHEGMRQYWDNLSSEERSIRNVEVWASASPELKHKHGAKVSATKRNWSPEKRAAIGARLSAARKSYWAAKTPEERAKKGDEMRRARPNHRVKSVIYLGEREVFDLTTSTSNFGLAAEIFAHNSGAFDIIKGQKPTGVEAFSALQLLVERSQSRFTSVFQSRGEMYRHWFGLAIELERQFGPQQRTWAVTGPNRGYTFRHFENAQLQAQVSMQIEDGSNMPKTALGKRAAIEQANQLMLLNPADPDQKYALLTQFGLSDLVPSLNFHVQSALQLQDAFERWLEAPQGPSPLVIKPWFDPQIHWIERIKWLNTDKMREIMQKDPQVEVIITQHLQMLQLLLAPPTPVGPGGKPAPQGPPPPHGAPPTGPHPPTGAHAPGGGQALAQSNHNSGAPNQGPMGNAQHGPQVGPA